MREIVHEALRRSPTIDITTTGRKTGVPRRIEIWMFAVGDRFVITGTPGRRDWLANLSADPRFTIHIPNGARMIDVQALAVRVDDEAFRREVFTSPHISWYSTQAQLETLIATAPMIEVLLETAE